MNEKSLVKTEKFNEISVIRNLIVQIIRPSSYKVSTFKKIPRDLPRLLNPQRLNVLFISHE